MSTSVEITGDDSDGYTAVDSETGATASGESRSDALKTLAKLLEKADEWQSEGVDPAERFEEISDEVQNRFEERDLDEDVVEDAIEWARST